MDEKGRVWGSRHSFSLGRYAGRFSFASESGRFFLPLWFFLPLFWFFLCVLVFFVFLEMDQWRLGRFGPWFFLEGEVVSLLRHLQWLDFFWETLTRGSVSYYSFYVID